MILSKIYLQSPSPSTLNGWKFKLLFNIITAPNFWQKLIEQTNLVSTSMLIACLIGIPLGILMTRFRIIKMPLMRLSAVLWTIPSLALLAFLIPFLGIGFKPAIVALSVYALLPILRATVTGLESVPKATLEAASGLGLSRWQRMRLVEIPLAMPGIMSGIRTAMAMSVGVATLAAFIGAGGLGDFINRGLAMNNTALILQGAIPAALMALLLDFALQQVEMTVDARQARPNFFVLALAFLILMTLPISFFSGKATAASNETITVSTKNFTEQYILGEMISQLIEHHTTLRVNRKFNLGSTAILQKALHANEVDLYPEYTGTAYLNVLHRPYHKNNDAHIYNIVKREYARKYHLTWLTPLGFSNSQGLTVRQDFANRYHIKTISDLVRIAPRLTIGSSPDLLSRPDGLPGLKKVYHLKFHAVKSMDPGLMYQAIRKNKVDVIMAFTTDGRISAYHLKVLRDDKHVFPPYDCAIVIRQKTLKQYPQLKHVLQLLSRQISTKTMRRLNYQVDVEHKEPFNVAHTFLIKHKLLKRDS
jgi:osmoprotectant transport system substrate-binding protein/osmoprotectant transport system permease protein